jgi:hypothetical protein
MDNTFIYIGIIIGQYNNNNNNNKENVIIFLSY